MALPTLIYDRTQEDANRWLYLSTKLDTEGWTGLSLSEQSEWLTDLKGGYNCSDLNRVGTAVEYLGGRFRNLITHLIAYHGEYGVASDPLFETPYITEDVVVAPKTDWQITDHVRASQAASFLTDLSTIRSLIPLPKATPAVPPDMEDLTFAEANDIEKLLQIVDTEITLLTEKLEKWIYDTSLSWMFSGEVFSQEV